MTNQDYEDMGFILGAIVVVIIVTLVANALLTAPIHSSRIKKTNSYELLEAPNLP